LELSFMPLSMLLTYAVTLFVAAAIPGPGMTAIIGRALSLGPADSLAMGLGLILGDLVYLTAVISGLAVLAENFAGLFAVLRFLGAGWLAYTAYRIWTAGLAPAEAEGAVRRTLPQSFANGLLITLGNPKVMIFYIALVPSLVPIAEIGWNRISSWWRPQASCWSP
jgi:threonine/homoserine/homoserine lactone efflux protein